MQGIIEKKRKIVLLKGRIDKIKINGGGRMEC